MSSCGTIELPILSRGPTHVYPEFIIQHDVSTQADMFLACSSPKEPGTTAVKNDSAVSLTDNMYINIVNHDYINYSYKFA